MHDVQRTKKITFNKNGKDATIGNDVQQIMSLTHDLHIEKASEASVWLCALYTGAHAITITSVLLKDFIAVFKPDEDEETDRVIICIQYTRTKGLTAWNHVVSIEGQMNTPGQMDFVYNLNKHLYLYFGVCLNNFNEWNRNLTT